MCRHSGGGGRNKLLLYFEIDAECRTCFLATALFLQRRISLVQITGGVIPISASEFVATAYDLRVVYCTRHRAMELLVSLPECTNAPSCSDQIASRKRRRRRRRLLGGWPRSRPRRPIPPPQCRPSGLVCRPWPVRRSPPSTAPCRSHPRPLSQSQVCGTERMASADGRTASPTVGASRLGSLRSRRHRRRHR